MIKINVKKMGNYPVSTPKIKSYLKTFFEKEGITSDADVSVIFVGEKKMRDLAKHYLKGNGDVHDVLSFPFIESDKSFVEPPDNVIHLGEIVVCYPKVVEEAKKEGKLIDEKAQELLEHGALHLLGKHH